MSLRFGEDKELSWHIVDAVKVEVIVRFADSIFERQSAVIAGCRRFLGRGRTIEAVNKQR